MITTVILIHTSATLLLRRMRKDRKTVMEINRIDLRARLEGQPHVRLLCPLYPIRLVLHLLRVIQAMDIPIVLDKISSLPELLDLPLIGNTVLRRARVKVKRVPTLLQTLRFQ